MSPRLRRLALLVFLGALAACGGTQERTDMVWVNDHTMVVPKRGLFTWLDERIGTDAGRPARMAAALEHNCPLEQVVISREGVVAAGRFRYELSVCGVSRVYETTAGHEPLEMLLRRAGVMPVAPDTTGEPAAPDAPAAPGAPAPPAAPAPPGTPAPAPTPAPPAPSPAPAPAP